MATIQSKNSRGHKYWYIVESRRVNGKPRPIVLAYLGKADDLLKRLQGQSEKFKLKSYSHGAIAILLKITHQLDIINIVNKYVNAKRSYMTKKPIRNNITAGATFILGAIGRICHPTSKNGFWDWAKTTSLQYLLRISLKKINSQHFWNMMDVIPISAIEKIEAELLKKINENYEIEPDMLFFDLTNFYTFINTTNSKASLAQRGKNKQKRNNLRQVGLALVVSNKNFIPLFHHTYQGNTNDSVIFKKVIKKIKKRMIDLNFNIEKLTVVFDRGNNSKENLKIIKELGFYYVGALTPYHHKNIIEEADGKYKEINFNENKLMVYREKHTIWEEERTLLIFISDKLKAGQIRGIYQSLNKKEKQLQEIKESLANPKAKKRDIKKLKAKIKKIVKGQFINDVIIWDLKVDKFKKYKLTFSIDKNKLKEIEEKLGFKIIMTNRHTWDTEKIIKGYYGQSHVEDAFKNMKNPFHNAVTPEYHWTNHKIQIHYAMCVMGYLLAKLTQMKVKSNCNFSGSLNKLLNILSNIRLGTLLEKSKKPGRVKAIYKLEEMSDEEKKIVNALEIENFHIEKPKFKGVGVYN
jgi:transposase